MYCELYLNSWNSLIKCRGAEFFLFFRNKVFNFLIFVDFFLFLFLFWTVILLLLFKFILFLSFGIFEIFISIGFWFNLLVLIKWWLFEILELFLFAIPFNKVELSPKFESKHISFEFTNEVSFCDSLDKLKSILSLLFSLSLLLSLLFPTFSSSLLPSSLSSSSL